MSDLEKPRPEPPEVGKIWMESPPMADKVESICDLYGHVWDLKTEPGAPICCMFCGVEYPAPQGAARTIRENLDRLIEEEKKKGEADG